MWHPFTVVISAVKPLRRGYGIFPGFFSDFPGMFFLRNQFSKQASKEASKQVGKQASQPACKQASKQAKEGKEREVIFFQVYCFFICFCCVFFVFQPGFVAFVASVAFVGW